MDVRALEATTLAPSAEGEGWWGRREERSTGARGPSSSRIASAPPAPTSTCEVLSVGERCVQVEWVSRAMLAAAEVFGSLDLLLVLMGHTNAISLTQLAAVSRAWREAAIIKEREWCILRPSHTISPACDESHSTYSEFVAILPDVCGSSTRIIVSDTHTNQLQCLDRDGRRKARYGRLGSVPGCLSKPRGLVCDDAGVFVVDSGNRRRACIHETAFALVLYPCSYVSHLSR